MRCKAVLILSRYGHEVTDEETGATYITDERRSEFAARMGGRFATQRDWLALSHTLIVPSHGLAVDAVWFDADNPDHVTALAEVRADARYEVLTDAEEVGRDETTESWPA